MARLSEPFRSVACRAGRPRRAYADFAVAEYFRLKKIIGRATIARSDGTCHEADFAMFWKSTEAGDDAINLNILMLVLNRRANSSNGRPLLALFGRVSSSGKCPLLGVKQT